MTVPPAPESLLVHAPRLRALARRLVRDGNEADDLVQETWVRALECSSPEGVGPARRWLTAVMRNLAFDRTRASARRTERERRAARPESTAPADGFAKHRELVEELDALGEPYREVVLLRYFEDLPPRRIAAQLGVPVKTVKTRLGRGLALLRERLERRHGGRAEWLAAMAPWLGWPSGPPPAPAWPWALGAALVKTQVKVAALVALVAAVGLYVVLPVNGPSAEAPAVVTAAAAPVVSLDDEKPAATPPERADQRTEVATAPELAAASSDTEEVLADLHTLHGRVLDAEGIGLAGVQLGVDGERAGEVWRALSGPGGSFQLGTPRTSGRIRSADPRFATVLAADFGPPPGPSDLDREHLVVVARGVALAGTVVDDEDRPVAAATVRVRLPDGFRSRFREVLDRAIEHRLETATDESGRFAFELAPAVEGARLTAARRGVGAGWIEVPPADDGALRVVLAPPASSDDDAITVEGVVLHPDGAAAAGAMVALGGTAVGADELGRFLLQVPARGAAGRELVAIAEGALPATRAPDRDAEGNEVWPEYVELVLGGEALSISGVVLAPDGTPLAEAVVWVGDPTFLGSDDSGYMTLEQLAGGTGSGWSSFAADTDGRFRIPGLHERAYGVRAMDPETVQMAEVGPIEAGREGLTLRLAADGLWERVVGRVVDRRGSSIARAQVWPVRTVQKIESPYTNSTWWHPSQGRGTFTDEDGRFELEGVPREGMHLSVSREDILPRSLELDATVDPSAVLVEVSVRCHVQFALVDPGDDVKSLQVLGEAGEVIHAQVFSGGSRWSYGTVQLTEGRSPVLSLPDTASTAVLFGPDGQELRRVPIRLTPGEPSTIDL